MAVIVIADGLEKSPSSKARCQSCGCLIKEGTPRLTIPGSFTHRDSHYYYCYKCTIKRIDEDIKKLEFYIQDLKQLKIDYDKIIEDCSKALIVTNL